MKRLWATIDRWGPGAISVLTLLAVIVLSWNYDRQLAARNATINGLQQEINILNTQIARCKSLPENIDNTLQSLKDRVHDVESDEEKTRKDLDSLDIYTRGRIDGMPWHLPSSTRK